MPGGTKFLNTGLMYSAQLHKIKEGGSIYIKKKKASLKLVKRYYYNIILVGNTKISEN
jgi:hypothetical protein